MAHADYRMKGRCRICEQSMFVGVCPHGMAERVRPPLPAAPTITPAEIEEALKKAIPGAIELDKKLERVFRPPTAKEDLPLR